MELRDQLQSTFGATYTLERELARGGMSRVFLASENALHRRVVVKVLDPELAATLSAERFAREVRVAAQLHQANIVPVLAAGEAGALPFYTMPYVDGESLRGRLLARQPLPLAEAVSILRDVARALVHAHGHGVIHRDIKPENILLSGGAAVVTDFGIAKAIVASRTNPDIPSLIEAETKLTGLGTTLGTPAYMAPEQVSGDPGLDHRADLYSFGCLGYELLTGTPPFDRRSIHELLRAHIAETPRPLLAYRGDVPLPLARIMMQCLEKDPAARPQSAQVVLDSIDRVTSPAPVATRRRGQLIASGVGLAAAILMIILWRSTKRTAVSSDTVAVVLLTTPAPDSLQHVAPGVAEELSRALGEAGLKPIARGAAAKFDGIMIDAGAVARELMVDLVIEVRVRLADSRGANVQATADIVTDKNRSLWSTPGGRKAMPLHAAVTELVDDVAGHLGGGARARQVVAGRHEPTAESYDEYLRGLNELNRGGSYVTAIGHFRRAIAADSAHAAPYAAAAWAYEQTAEAEVASLEAYARADSLASRAVALDPTNATAQVALAQVRLVLKWDWDGARAGFQRALAQNPSDPSVHAALGMYALMHSDLDESVRETRISQRLDKYSPVSTLILEWAFVARGQPDSAIHEQRRLDQIMPGEFPFIEAYVAEAFRMKGMIDSALAVDSAASRKAGFPTSGLVLSLVAAHRQQDAEAAYARLVAKRKSGQFIGSVLLARAALALGRRNEALDWLERARDEHADILLFAHATFRDLRALESEPRYVAILQRIKVPH